MALSSGSGYLLLRKVQHELQAPNLFCERLRRIIDFQLEHVTGSHWKGYLMLRLWLLVIAGIILSTRRGEVSPFQLPGSALLVTFLLDPLINRLIPSQLGMNAFHVYLQAFRKCRSFSTYCNLTAYPLNAWEREKELVSSSSISSAGRGWTSKPKLSLISCEGR